MERDVDQARQRVQGQRVQPVPGTAMAGRGTDLSRWSGILRMQRVAGNRATASLVRVQREPYSPVGASARAAEIDAVVRSRPDMPLGELEGLMRERDRILPLASTPPRPAPADEPTHVTDPALLSPSARWAAFSPVGASGAVTLAAGMMMVPVPSAPPPVPPAVLFPELVAEVAPVAVEGAAVGEAGGALGLAALEAGELGAVGGAAAGSSLVPVIGWVVVGVIVVGVAAYLLYRHYHVEAPPRIEAPGAPGRGPVSVPGPDGRGPVVLPGSPGRGPVSLPGASSSGPVSLPGARVPDGPLLVSGLPTHRTDFPTREAALRRALELARGLVLNDLEEIERADVFGTPEEAGHVTYYRGRGSTAEMRGSEPRGNIVAIVEHTSDPTQPPHFHVVRPPTAGARIEHGGVYSEPFEGTPDQHLTVNPQQSAVRP